MLCAESRFIKPTNICSVRAHTLYAVNYLYRKVYSEIENCNLYTGRGGACRISTTGEGKNSQHRVRPFDHRKVSIISHSTEPTECIAGHAGCFMYRVGYNIWHAHMYMHGTTMDNVSRTITNLTEKNSARLWSFNIATPDSSTSMSSWRV